VPDRPTAAELIEAVTEFLSTEMLPAATDHRLKFRTLVALNALGIASRELQAEAEEPLSAEEVVELAKRIRAGDVRDGDHAVLKEHVAAKLRISNPAYLERYE
jgi:predicted nucleotidyltransferase component of viral defense system